MLTGRNCTHNFSLTQVRKTEAIEKVLNIHGRNCEKFLSSRLIVEMRTLTRESLELQKECFAIRRTQKSPKGAKFGISRTVSSSRCFRRNRIRTLCIFGLQDTFPPPSSPE